MNWSPNPDHAPRGPFLHLRAAHARRRPARPDRCAATHSAPRLGLICLARRRTGARTPAAHALDGARGTVTPRYHVARTCPTARLISEARMGAHLLPMAFGMMEAQIVGGLCHQRI